MVNHLVFQGRMVVDPVVNDTNSGVKVANFRVAWSEKYKEKETKCFLECKAFAALAEHIGKYFVKGQEIVVEGKLNTEEWEKDGQKRSKIVLVVASAHFCGKKADNPGSTAAEPAPAPASTDYTVVEEDTLPF